MRSASLLLGFNLLLLAGCGTMVEGQTQRVSITTPGASESRCTLDNGVRYVLEGGESAEIMRSNNALVVDCYAAGNRHKTMKIPSGYNNWSTANILNGALPGYGYDHISGGLYTYPELIVMDFTAMPPRDYDLPSYHRPDAPSPYGHGVESYTAGTPKLQSDGDYLKRDIQRLDTDRNSNPFAGMGTSGRVNP